jgi:hypothetical protein
MSGGDVLDRAVSPTRPDSEITKDEVLQHSGHRMLCPKCKMFRRAETTFIPGGMLRIACKVCKTFSDFVIRKEGFVPKNFDARIRSFAKKRVRDLLGGSHAKS